MTPRAEQLLEIIRIIEEYSAKKLFLCDVEARFKYELAKELAPGAFIQEIKR
jgi:hypothetical protein